MPKSPWRTVALITAAVITGNLPVFLTGGLSVQVSDDLNFSESLLGLGVASYFIASAAGSAMLGRAAQRIGLGRSLAIAAATGAVSLTGLALAANWGMLAVALAIGGASNALGQPAANGVIVRVVPVERRALAFGIKQSAIPTAVLLGGLAVPLISLTVGWRWAYALGAAGALLVALLVVRSPLARQGGTASSAALPRRELEYLPLIVLSAGVGFASVAANVLGAFLVSSAVDSGISDGAAGLVSAMGSAIGLSMRLLMGWRADRGTRDPLAIVMLMMIGGMIGFTMLATGFIPLFLVGVVFGFGAGWAWPGLFNYAVSHRYGDAAAAATGLTQSGVYIGGASGPVIFGVLVEATSYTVGWLTVTAVVGVGVLCLWTARQMLARRPVETELASVAGD